jgi:hypothetical protein
LLLTLQPHFAENSKQIFPEMKLRGLIPNFACFAAKKQADISRE